MPGVDEVLESAAASTGLDDFGSPHFRAPLACWGDDLDGPALSPRGRDILERVALQNLRTRLEVTDALKRHPEIADVALPRIVMIAGFARSGTTLLHNLLTCHPGTRALQRWELMRPVPPPEAESWPTDARRAEVQRSADSLRGTALERLHWVNADEPEECTWGFYDCTGLLGRGPMAFMPTWSDHLLSGSLAPTLDEYKRLIQLLLWRNPPPAGSVLVLKSPLTTPNLEEFSRAFPAAHYIFTHRDPFRAVVSVNAVADAIATPLCVEGFRPGAVDGGGDRFALRILGAAATAMESFASLHPGRVAHVRYADLMVDPVGVTEGTLAAMGVDVEPGVSDRVNAFLAAQRQGHRKAPPASYEYTYTREDVLTDPAMASYVTTFDVPIETQRVVDPVAPAKS